MIIKMEGAKMVACSHNYLCLRFYTLINKEKFGKYQGNTTNCSLGKLLQHDCFITKNGNSLNVYVEKFLNEEKRKT